MLRAGRRLSVRKSKGLRLEKERWEKYAQDWIERGATREHGVERGGDWGQEEWWKQTNTQLQETKNKTDWIADFFLPPKSHKDIFKLQGVGHFGPFDPNVIRIGVLRLVVEPAGQGDGATAMRHHFTRSRLHDHRSSVVLCWRKEKEHPLLRGWSIKLSEWFSSSLHEALAGPFIKIPNFNQVLVECSSPE